jgi:uncharacterized repeat protein (TIGR01451 family)
MAGSRSVLVALGVAAGLTLDLRPVVAECQVAEPPPPPPSRIENPPDCGPLPTGIVIISSGEDVSVLRVIPFTFQFWGTPRTSVYVSSNGFLTFNSSGATSFNNTAIPNLQAPNDAVYSLWDDWRITPGAEVREGLLGIVPARVYVVEWRSVTHVVSGARATFQAQLFEGGGGASRVRLVVTELTAPVSFTSGVENRTGTAAIAGIAPGSPLPACVELAFPSATAPPPSWPFARVENPPDCGMLPTPTTPVANGDDVYQQVDIGFPFRLFGREHEQGFVSSNGFISFESGSTSFITAPIPTTTAPNFAVYGLWDDWSTVGGGAILDGVVGTAPERVHVTEWSNVSTFGGGGSGRFQVQLFENGGAGEKVRIIATDVTPASRRTQQVSGLEDPRGESAAQGVSPDAPLPACVEILVLPRKRARIELSALVPSPPLVAGDPSDHVVYTIRVRNDGNVDLPGAVLEDTLPESLEWVDVDSCEPPLLCTIEGPTLSVTGFDLTAYKPVEYTISARARPTCATMGAGVAVAWNQALLCIGDEGWWSDAVPVTIESATALANPTKTVSFSDPDGDGSPMPGELLATTIGVQVGGTAPSRDVVVVDDLSGQTCLDYSTLSVADGGVFDGEAITWRLGDVAPASVATVSYSVAAAAEVACCNRATVQSAERVACGIGALLTNAACVTPRSPPPILQLATSSAPVECAPGGGVVTLAFTVTNAGFVPVDGWSLSDPLPAGMSAVDADAPLRVDGPTFVLDAGPAETLQPGEQRPFMGRARVPCSDTSPLRNVATLRYGADQVVTAEADVAWSVPDLGATFLTLESFDGNGNGYNEAGEDATWLLVLRNDAACPARDVVATITLDDRFDPSSVAFEPGSEGRLVGDTVTWSAAEILALEDLAPGSEVALRFTLRVHPVTPQPQRVPMVATVTVGGSAAAPCPVVTRAVPADAALLWGDQSGATRRMDLLRNADWPARSVAEILAAREPNLSTCGASRLAPVRDTWLLDIGADLAAGLTLVDENYWGLSPLVLYEVTESCLPSEGGTDVPICVRKSGADIVIHATATPGTCP